MDLMQDLRRTCYCGEQEKLSLSAALYRRYETWAI